MTMIGMPFWRIRNSNTSTPHCRPDGGLIILSKNVRDLQIELPRLAQSNSIVLRRVEPLDDSLESVFGYLVER